MPKDRTAELIRIRQEIQNVTGSYQGDEAKDDEGFSHGSGSGSAAGPTDSAVLSIQIDEDPLIKDGDGDIGAKFLENVKLEAAWAEVLELRENIQQVRRLQSTIINSPSPESRTNNELETLMGTIRTKSCGIRANLKDIKEEIAKEENEGRMRVETEPESEENSVLITRRISTYLRIGKTQHSALLRFFVELMQDFQLAQIDYRDKCKTRVYRQLEINGNPLTDDEVDKIIEEGALQIFTKGIIRDTNEARQILALVESRHKDLIKLEKSIQELHDLFMEMAFIVESQDEVIDGIERTVTKTQAHVEHAGDDISEFKFQSSSNSMRQRSTRMKRIKTVKFILLTIIIFLIIFIIICLSYSL